MIHVRLTTALRWLLQIDRPVPVRSDLEIHAEAARNYRWNFAVNLLDGTTFWLGLSFISSATVVPLFISKLTPSQLAIGLAAMIAQASWFLPQLFTANAIERLARKKPVVVNLGFFTERLPVWLLPLAAMLAVQSPSLALILFFLGYAGHGLGAGLVATAWQDLIARCFPVNRRGRLFGVTTFLGNGTGALGALVSAWLLAAFLFPTNFAVLFAIAAFFITLSWAFLALTREPVQPITAPRQTNHQFWASLPGIVGRDQNYGRFLIGRLQLVLGTMGLGFVTVAAIQRWQVPDSTVGFYTTALLLGQTGGTLAFGLLADRRGHLLSLQLGALVSLAAFVLAWLAPSPEWYYVVFVLLGIGGASILISGMLVVLEFAPPQRRPTYSGLTNTAVGLLSLLAPLLGAGLASLSYNALFLASAIFNLSSLVALRWWVREPRWAGDVGTLKR
jgi:MFS family permease